MKKKVIILVLLIMLLFSQVGYLNAQEEEKTGILGFNSGNKYLEGSERERFSYVIGLIDMFWYSMDFAFPEIYEQLRARMEGMTGGQIQKIFEKYLEEHPERLHVGAAELFHMAMVEILIE